MVTAIIDLNIRVRGRQTFTGLEDVDGPVRAGQAVKVIESESGIHGEGVVTEVDHTKRLVYLAVDWAGMRLPDGEE